MATGTRDSSMYRGGGGNEWGPQAPIQSPLGNQYNLYNQAVGQNAEDYDYIMGGLKDAIGRVQSSGNSNQLVPQTYDYHPSAAVNSSIANLGELARTGGYSDADTANIRARGVSPIRSVYANANRDIDRNKALQGGFSANYAAAKSKMAREMSEKLATATTDIEANLAEKKAAGRLSAASPYASAAGNESSLRNNIGMQNTNSVNDANKFNATQHMTNQNDIFQGLSQMSNLYGTTPALSRLYGEQASNMAAQETQNQNNALGTATNALSPLMRRYS